MPALRRITIYPIKALDGCDVPEAEVLPSGALKNDRRWAIVDGQSRFINGKRTPAVHLLRANYDASVTAVTLSVGQVQRKFELPGEAAAVGQWLSDLFELKCRLIENADGGFPDDGDASGPTLVSTQSLSAAAEWFEGVDVAEMRRRIRANLEFDAPAPFWEDQLADHGGAPRRIAVGSVALRGRTICARCIVPTRNSQTAATDAQFAREFVKQREASLPEWAPMEQFDHYYRLAINTSPDWIDAGAVVRLGDEVKLLSKVGGTG